MRQHQPRARASLRQVCLRGALHLEISGKMRDLIYKAKSRELVTFVRRLTLCRPTNGTRAAVEPGGIAGSRERGAGSKNSGSVLLAPRSMLSQQWLIGCAVISKSHHLLVQ
jgi:hypothetical protein